MEKHFLIITDFEGKVETKVFKAKNYDEAMQKFDDATAEYNPMQYVKGVFVSIAPIVDISP